MYLLLQKISIRRDRGRNVPCAVSGQPTYLQGTGKYSDTREGAVHPHSPPFSWVFTGSLLQLEWGNSSIFTRFLLKLVFFFQESSTSQTCSLFALLQHRGGTRKCWSWAARHPQDMLAWSTPKLCIFRCPETQFQFSSKKKLNIYNTRGNYSAYSYSLIHVAYFL